MKGKSLPVILQREDIRWHKPIYHTFCSLVTLKSSN